MNSHEACTSFSWTLGGMNILMRPGQSSLHSKASSSPHEYWWREDARQRRRTARVSRTQWSSSSSGLTNHLERLGSTMCHTPASSKNTSTTRWITSLLNTIFNFLKRLKTLNFSSMEMEKKVELIRAPVSAGTVPQTALWLLSLPPHNDMRAKTCKGRNCDHL